MFCIAGAILLHRFVAAAEARAEAKDDVLRAQGDLCTCQEQLYRAKQVHTDALVVWVTHRSLCLDCRAASSSHDLEQFASL